MVFNNMASKEERRTRRHDKMSQFRNRPLCVLPKGQQAAIGLLQGLLIGRHPPARISGAHAVQRAAGMGAPGVAHDVSRGSRQMAVSSEQWAVREVIGDQ